jgi:putative ABC transport system substrate-binding protein
MTPRRQVLVLPRARAVTLAAAVGLLVLAQASALHPQQRGKVYSIGVFHVGDHVPPGLEPLRAGLKALGWEEGRNLRLDFRNLTDQAAADRTAWEFRQAHSDLIIAFGNPTVRAARAVTSEIPIVMIHVTDPVAQGFVKTLARPGGNLTGFVFFAISPGKHVELFKEVVPALRHLLVLVDPRDPATVSQLREIRKAAEILKIKLTEREAMHQGDLQQAFRSIKHTDIEGVMSASNTLHIRFTAVLIRLALDERVPFAGYRRDAVEEGALFSYAPDDAAVGREAAVVVDKILRGARPSDIPVEQPRKFELAINRKTAKLLGLAIPSSVLLRADRVVE